MAKKTLNYKEAHTELNEILSHLESDQTDVDLLAEKVKRARFLIEFCKGKLRGIESELDAIYEND